MQRKLQASEKIVLKEFRHHNIIMYSLKIILRSTKDVIKLLVFLKINLSGHYMTER